MEPSSLAGARTALITRYFTDGATDPFDTVTWEVRDAWPDVAKYHNPGITVPTSWSQNALDITSKLYLAKADDYVEKSIRQLIERVVSKYTLEAIRHGYFSDYCIPAEVCRLDVRGVELDGLAHYDERMELIDLYRSKYGADCPPIIFYDELCFILLHQLAAFNSPVWFNVGRHDRKQQCSACFILSVEDNTTSIMETARREAFIFKGGSGSGFDISRIRGSMESLSTGGLASGPVSFMRLWDSGAGTFKSGGTTRRAAKLVKCDVDHPDIVDFIECKIREEDRLRILAAAGVNISFDEEGERNVAEATSFQNANNSVGVTDDFMYTATGQTPDDVFILRGRTGSAGDQSISASGLLRQIAEAAWKCADPGLQFMDHMNAMHTTPMIDGKASPIRSTNPCGEYMSNDDTSCNLASINVAKFVNTSSRRPHEFGRTVPDAFQIEDCRHVIDVMSFAMDVSVSFGEFPDEIIADYSRKLRQLGLGVSNLGAAIMLNGLPYDSAEARDFAASVVALITGRTYHMSAEIAGLLEPFHYFEENRETMLKVIDRHFEALPSVIKETTRLSQSIWAAAMMDWAHARSKGAENGFRNSQASVLAPAGSISYLMDCDTTGVEPAFTLVTHKDLAGGGSMTLINQSVDGALQALGYDTEAIEAIEACLRNNGSMPDPDTLMFNPEHAAVFHGANDISADGHIQMLAAVQPFVSGGISKTINMPEGAMVEDVLTAYVHAWELGVKDLAIYRNNSKARQILTSIVKKSEEDFSFKAADYVNGSKVEVISSARQGSSAPHPPVVHRDEIKFTAGEIDERVVQCYLEDFRKGISHHTGTKDGSMNPSMAEAARRHEIECLEKHGPPKAAVPVRRRLPRTRDSKTHKIHVHSAMGDHEGYVTVGFYPDGTIGEMFLEGFGRLGGFTQNALSRWATDFSIALQYGVPLAVLARKDMGHADETGGQVVPGDEPLVIRTCESISDYVVKWVVSVSGDVDLAEDLGVMTDAVKARKIAALDGNPAPDLGHVIRKNDGAKLPISNIQVGVDPGLLGSKPAYYGVVTTAVAPSDNGHGRTVEMGPPCNQCGARMHRAGACWQCRCGNNTGCS